MIDRPHSHPDSSHSTIFQIADLLAQGYLRLRKRQAQRLVPETFSKVENCLDDVDTQATVRKDRNRTLEKGDAAHNG